MTAKPGQHSSRAFWINASAVQTGRSSGKYAWRVAFFRRDVLKLLDRERGQYAIKTLLHDWLGLKRRIQKRKWWTVADTDVDFFTTRIRIKPWKRTEKTTLYRRLVNHRRSKHFQLDLFDPDDGHYEYSAVASNKSLSGRGSVQYVSHFFEAVASG
jgi:hypothetical protein